MKYLITYNTKTETVEMQTTYPREAGITIGLLLQSTEVENVNVEKCE